MRAIDCKDQEDESHGWSGPIVAEIGKAPETGLPGDRRGAMIGWELLVFWTNRNGDKKNSGNWFT